MPLTMQTTDQSCPATETLLNEIAEHGYTISDDFLPPATVSALNLQARALHASGRMHAAGIGKDTQHQVIKSMRGDSTCWLDENTASDEQAIYLARMQTLQGNLNRAFFLGLAEFETHFAVYPPGAVYHRHLDQFRGQQERQLSAILYLNQDWQPEDGGELRLYLDAAHKTRTPLSPAHIGILPLGGRLLLFLSGRFFHEVLPARRERISLTGWFRTRGQQ
jgi:SM-20-related protein